MTAYDDISKIKEMESEKLQLDYIADKSKDFAPYAYFESFVGLADWISKDNHSEWYSWHFHEYPENAKFGDVVVYNVEPSDESSLITFYPKGTPRYTNGDENYVLDFFSSNSDASEMLGFEKIMSLSTYDRGSLERLTNVPYDFITRESLLYINSLLDKQVTEWLCDKNGQAIKMYYVSTYNINLKDKNLLGFEPKINVAIRSNVEKTNHSIKYGEYQLSDNAIVFSANTRERENSLNNI